MIRAIRTATGGVRRHKVQAMVLATVVLVSTASALVGLALLAAADAPFQQAFTAWQGANLTVTVNPARTNANRLAATRTLTGVTGMAGPFAETTVLARFAGRSLGPRLLVGRATPGGPVDDVQLPSGHWPDGPGQVVLDAGPGGGSDGPWLGSRLDISGAPGTSTLTVTGFATSITRTADGWVTPAEAANLHGASAQLLYRFATAGSDAQIHADAAEITMALPGAVTGTGSWLTSERIAAGNAAIMAPFVVAFALLGLAMAVLITGNVVSGMVAAQYHRIGVLKSIGMSPAQVIAVYLSRVGWPALAGCLAGLVAGNLLAVPLLSGSSGIYGIGRKQVPWWASVAAGVGILALTALAAFGPALRAGRLSAVQAIAAGRAPRSGRGYRAHRLIAWLPGPVGIGLAAPFTRPARTAVTLIAIAFGACAVIFAVGLDSALSLIQESQTHSATAEVQIQLTEPHAAPNAAVPPALRAQPGTLRDVAVYGEAVKVPGVAQTGTAQVFGGDASWLDYAIITGRWFAAPGEVAVNAAFLTGSGLAVGDTTTVTTGTTRITVRIVGEVFDPASSPRLYGDVRTLPGAQAQAYEVALRQGTDVDTYLRSVNQALGSHSPWLAARPQGNSFYPIATGMVGLLTLTVTVAAALGVLNTVLMTTRDRVHDLGIYKAIGMRPGQLLAMVVCQVVGPAVVAAVIAAPVVVALTTATVQAMAGTAHTDLPASFTQVLPPSRLALLSLAALGIAVAGALLPASWAARARPATALRAE